MRIIIVTMIAVVLLGSFVIYGYTSWQNQVERQNAGPGECAATGLDSAAYTARLSVSDDITKESAHIVSLESSSHIVIHCSSLGHRTVTIPPNLISAKLTVENVPKSEVVTGDSNNNQTAQDILRFQITGLEAKVKSFNFPTRGITGENIFQILKERSSVEVYGSSGIVKLSGKAEATLMNSIFTSSNPVMVKMTFQGEYNFSTKTATLTRIDAFAHSPSTKDEVRK